MSAVSTTAKAKEMPKPRKKRSDRARLSGDGAVQTGFFGDGGRVALVPCDDINLISLDRALQPHGRHLGDEAGAQLFGHGLDIVLVQIQFVGDLPVRQVEPQEVKAQ